MPRELLWSPLLTLEEKGLVSFFYSMPYDSTEEDVAPLCGIPNERLEELVDSLLAKGMLDYDAGYRLHIGGAL